MPQTAEAQAGTVLDVAVIGAGFAGLCMAIQLKNAGLTNFAVFEKAEDIGGTWRDNTYPGCACDVQSHLYSFSFEPNPNWSRMFAPQPEIFDYLKHCTEKYQLKPFLRLGRKIVHLSWNDDIELWNISTEDGETVQAQTVVAAIGALHVPAYPAAPGREKFQGKSFHSAEWAHDYDLQGKRVAVIGTGASAIQFVPKIVPQVASLKLFQRTPPWIMSKPDRLIRRFEKKLFQLAPITQRLFRSAIYLQLESRVLGFAVSPKLMRVAELAAKAHIRKQIKDPALRRKVTPDYTAGCKRILMSDDYYPALAQPHVDVHEGGIREITERGVIDAEGTEHEVDVIIYGTGFRVQDPVIPGMVQGPKGVDLVEAWPKGPEAYLGMNVAGFPNFFFLLGPNSGLGHSSMIYMIESQVHYIIEALAEMRARRLERIDVRADVQQAYNEDIQNQLSQAVWASGCRSWYINEHGRNTTLWPGFTFRYRQRTRDFKLDNYRFSAEQAS